MCHISPHVERPQPDDPPTKNIQGVKLYYQHRVTRTRPSPKKKSSAIVKVTDLASGDEYKITTDKAVLNIPAEVGTCPLYCCCSYRWW